MIALLSDTHDNVGATARAIELLSRASPEIYLHLGDIGSPRLVSLFRGLPTRFIWGNNDTDAARIAEAVAGIGASIGECFEIDGALGRIFAAHGHTAAVRDAARSGRYVAVIFGHSHESLNELRGGVRFINPGALYRAREYSCALLDPDTLRVDFVGVWKG
ncbi:MAG: metallophosphoesterase family protein [Spirochaetales bacterium]